jgi:hypothetical protein
MGDTCKFMGSEMDWGEVMSRLYSGKEERKKLAQEIRERVLEEIEGKIKDGGLRRNLKEEYFKELLKRPDGFLLVECMAHLRTNFGQTHGLKVLSMILEEWREQAVVADSYDTFRAVLSHSNSKPIHICNALILQARRIRSRVGDKPKNAKAARSLVAEARKIWERNYEGDDPRPFPEKNFCLVPNRYYENVLDCQKIFCNARFADMRSVWTEADNKIDELDKSSEEGDWEGEHKPNLILKWWMHQVKLRASAVCIDLEHWKQAKDGMENIERDLEGSVHYYLQDIKGRSQKISPLVLNKYVASFSELKNMRVLLSDWSKFRQVEDKVLKFRRRGGAQQEGDWALKSVQEKFTASLKDFNKYLLMGAKSGFVSHAYARDKIQSRKRAEKILVEISEGRHYVTLSNTNHSCFQLEILHRLLIYRLWWESVEKGFDLFSNKEEGRGGVVLSLETPKEILKDIKYDLGEMHIRKEKNARWRKDFRKSIEIFGDGGENLATKLRERIEEFEHSFKKMQWPEGQDCIMGLPYIPNQDNVPDEEKIIGPYDVMDPTMRFVGVNAASAGLEQRPESQ